MQVHILTYGATEDHTLTTVGVYATREMAERKILDDVRRSSDEVDRPVIVAYEVRGA